MIQSGFFVKSSSCAIELDAWKVTTAGGELEFHFQNNPRLALDQGSGFGTGRTTRPVGTWFEAWSTIGRPMIEVNFIRRRDFKRHVRALLVVPVEE